MTTDTTLEFRNNQDMFNPEQIQPANVNVYDATNSFNKASMASSPVTLPGMEQVMNPQDPIIADIDKISLMNTVMMPNESLNTNVPQGIKTPAKGELNELSAGVSGVALEAAGALFGSVFEPKQDKFEDFVADVERKMQMNAAPKPPTIGMGIGGGPGG